MSALPQPTGPDEPKGPSPLDAIVRGPSSAAGQVSGEATHPGQPGTSAKGPVGPAVAHSPPVVSASEASREEHIREAQATLYRYLRYAASRSDIGLGKDLIDPLIPLLRQDAGAMSDADEARVMGRLQSPEQARGAGHRREPRDRGSDPAGAGGVSPYATPGPSWRGSGGSCARSSCSSSRWWRSSSSPRPM